MALLSLLLVLTLSKHQKRKKNKKVIDKSKKVCYNKYIKRKKEVMNMMKDKMTKKDWFETIRAFLEESDFEPKEEALNFLSHEIELLNKKSSSGKKTKNQKENEEIKKLILVALELFGKPVTVTTMIKENSEMNKLSPQKLSALLKQLVESEEVVRTVEKRVPYFSLAKEEEGTVEE